jgi:hypothetical protein
MESGSLPAKLTLEIKFRSDFFLWFRKTATIGFTGAGREQPERVNAVGNHEVLYL